MLMVSHVKKIDSSIGDGMRLLQQNLSPKIQNMKLIRMELMAFVNFSSGLMMMFSRLEDESFLKLGRMMRADNLIHPSEIRRRVLVAIKNNRVDVPFDPCGYDKTRGRVFSKTRSMMQSIQELFKI